MQPDYSPIWGVLLVTAILLAVGFRPRQPWVIHAHMNKMFIKVAFSIWFVFGLALLSAIPIIELSLPSWTGYIVGLLTILFLIFSMVYVLYWSQPFSRKQTGVKAVDKAVERYKRPGEQVEGAWAPPMELDDKRYWNIYYTGQNKKQWLLIDEQGQVLSDEAVAHTLRDMLRLVYQIGHPEYINNRTSAYMSSQKGITGLKTLLGQYEQLSLPVREHNGGKYADEMLAVRRAAEVGLRFQDGMCNYWLYEAEWGNKRGGTKLKELRYADWQELIGVLHQNTLWLRDEIETLEQGALAAKKIRQLTKKHPELAKNSPSLQYLLDAVITQHDDLNEAFDDLRQGRVRGYERGLDDELKGWRSLLEWVRQVDGWVVDGYTDKQIIEMKKKTSRDR